MPVQKRELLFAHPFPLLVKRSQHISDCFKHKRKRFLLYANTDFKFPSAGPVLGRWRGGRCE